MSRKNKYTNAELPDSTLDQDAPLENEQAATAALEAEADARTDGAAEQRPASVSTEIDPTKGVIEPLQPNASLEERRRYVVQHGLLTEPEAEQIDEQQLHYLVQSVLDSAGGTAALGAVRENEPAVLPPFNAEQPQTAIEAQRQQALPEGRASRVDAQMRSMGREDKIALITQNPASRISVAEAATLLPEDLDTFARGALEAKLEAEAQLARPISPMAPPPVGKPYGDDPPQHYVITNDIAYALDGQITQLTKGSIVNDRHYDIDALKRNGARLLKCEAPDPYLS